MSFRSDPLAELVVPDGTTVEEHAIVTDSDVIIGTQSTIALGVRGRNVVAGEQVTFEGDIEANSDCRLDMWCTVDGNVLVGENAYIGERVEIDGQLVVAGDLDIGDDVEISEGFDANGWIVIRNPVPTLMFLFTYLTHLLHLGEEEMAEDVLSEVFEGHDDQPVVIPKNATVGDDAWRVSTPARVGEGCRLHGNLRAESIAVGEDSELFGSLRARESITVERGTTIHGDVTTRGGSVEIAAEAHVRGDIACEQLRLHEGAVVEGAMRARGEMTIVQERGRPSERSGESDRDVSKPTGEPVDGANGDEPAQPAGERAESDESKGSFTSLE
ncbi:polymer-forming cytoskeletal protein [Halococcus sediminicola]|uniref:polymer-forming cytoskeletal protein n=1 Tax=Halococcus sediminicola TaxID=1264579 RepID=UPI000678E1F7|nr:polymer-forming cytoskeletal protein [Halococcus sediminicola]